MPQRNAISVLNSDGSAVVDKTAIKVAVIDDHPILCAGVAETFATEPGFEVVAMGSSAEDAQRIAQDSAPDVMLVDVNMPGDIFAVIKEISAKTPAIKTIVLTAFDDDYYLGRALRNGASGYILKGISSAELIKTTQSILDGALIIPFGETSPLTDTGHDAEKEAVTDLTMREEDILLLVSHGFNNAEIAIELGISEGTVKNHLTAVLKKLNLRNRVEAANYARSKFERGRLG